MCIVRQEVDEHMNRAFTNILCSDVETTAAFYEYLLDMTRIGDFGWFVILGHERLPGFELGVLHDSHETVPDSVRGQPSGAILTFVVDDVEVVFEKAQTNDVVVIQAPTDLPYGQRRLLLKDPAGTTVDVSAPVSQVSF